MNMPKRKLNITVDNECYHKLEKLAHKQGRSKSNMICRLILEYKDQ